jgi:pimeloyl-ACP methyl ester carboxylesterase
MNFTITSDENLPIRGTILAPPRPRALIVIAHGWKGFAEWGFFPWLTEQFVEHRFAACRFNMSRNGIGDDPETFGRLDLFAGDTYSAQIADLHAVVRYCRSIERLRGMPLFLLGHSRGGAIVLLGAEGLEGLRGIITWSSIGRTDRWDAATKERWRRDGFIDIENARTRQLMRMSTSILDDVERNAARLDVPAATARLTVPLLAIHGGRDESVPLAESRDLASRNDLASLLVIGPASHTYNAIHPLVHVPKELELAMTVSARFVAAWTTA